MNQFNEEILKAAARQRRFYLSLTAALLFCALFAGSFALFLKGTAIRVLPNEISDTAKIEVEEGFAAYIGGSIFSLSRQAEFSVSADGFETAEIRLTEEVEGRALNVSLKELPATLHVSTAKGMSDVQWRLNDKPIDIGRDLNVSVPAGKYSISALQTYHEPLTLEFDLARGQTVKKIIELTPVAGTLSLKVVPAQAKISINGGAPMTGPIDKSLAGGEYDVAVTLEGYTPVLETVKITNQKTAVTRSYKLNLLQSYALVSVVPEGGRLSLNGKPVKARVKLPVSATKPYFLRYEKPGYAAQERKISVQPGKIKAVSFSLKIEIGEVNVASTPSGAVFVNGQPMGNTPIKMRLPAIVHKLEIKRNGFRSALRTINPSVKSPLNLRISLKTEKAARQGEAKKSYKNSAGLTMRLFRPNKVTLGAPRHEKGQRANEFIRNVQLTQHFYVSEKEVSQSQFSAFKSGSKGKSKTLPVSGVSWAEAAAFCNWLSKKEGLTPFYKFVRGSYKGFNKQSNGYRLPSEAEWEWLARKAGRRTQTRFIWGDQTVIPAGAGNIADEAANGTTRFYVPNYVDGFATVAPVGSFVKDKAGLFDLFGNLSEWTHDFYSLIPPAKGASLTDPLGDQSGDKHVIKGASWSSGSLTEIRPAYRGAGNAGTKYVGFRVARYL
ncbi:MAG: SUMF1/EgtB/PvdO family nonheme iron enzyme [Sneathiella sp.]